METDSAKADEQARLIFYKIEGLVFDALRQELAEITAPLIREHLANQAAHADKPAGLPQSPHSEVHTQDNHKDPYHSIRNLITGFVQETLEEQAPQMIATILAKAFRASDDVPPNPPPPSPS